MRAVLTNSVRPRIGHLSPNLSLGRGAPARKTAFPATTRRLTFCDAFTILLAPVLTAAFVVDITQKDRRRHEWDQKLAQLLEEIEALKERELQSWKVLQLRSIKAGVAHQRRSYSTTATAVAQAHDEATLTMTAKGFPGEHFTDLQKYENFLATKVGLQLLLHICTARDPTSKLSMNGISDGTVIPDSLETLIVHLRRVNHGLRTLNQHLPVGAADGLLDTEERRELDMRVGELTWECRTGNISANELVYQYTQAVMRSRTGLSLQAYQGLVETFSTLDADALTFIAMFPYLRTRQVLDDATVVSIIHQYGKIKDAGRLDSFLQKLLQSEKSFQTVTRWEPIVVNGVRVPAPVNRRPRLLDILVRSALQVDQPHKAQAWATLLMQQKPSVYRFAAVFNNFLTYCAKHLNWRYGQLWLQKTIAWAALFAEKSPAMLQKLIFRMLDLCSCCNQHQLYDTILDAAVVAGLEAPPVDHTRPDSFAEQARSIRRDWTLRIKQNQTWLDGSNEALEPAIVFQAEMAKVDSVVQKFIGVTSIDKLQALQEESSYQLQSGATHLVGPDEILPSTLKPRIQESFEQWKEKSILCLDGEPRPSSRSDNDNKYRQTSDMAMQPSGPDRGHDTLKKRHKRDAEASEEAKGSLETNILFDHNGENSNHDLQELAENILRYQEQDAQYASRISCLEDELESLKTHASNLSIQLEAKDEKETELLKLNNQLKAQIDAVKPKSLEHVFLARENYNMRSELKELTALYSNVLSAKEHAQREASTLRTQYERLEEHSVTKMDTLRQENKALQKEIEILNMQYQKLTQDTKARQGNLLKLLSISEERAKMLRTELSKLEPASQPSPSATLSAKALPSGEDDEHDLDHEDQKHRTSLKFLRG